VVSQEGVSQGVALMFELGLCSIFSGSVVEFDAPSKLMRGPSVFGAMVQEYASHSSGEQATNI
jgi:hypothetical protein